MINTINIAPSENKRFTSELVTLDKVKTYFGSCVRPIELNVKLGINGTSIRLYDTTQKEKISLKGHYAMPLLNYFANTYNHRLLVDLCIRYYWRQLKKKFKK